MTRSLSDQADFQEQKPLLQEIVEGRGHIVIFLPKFHCELNNIIEYVWGVPKQHTRDNCDYTHGSKQARTLTYYRKKYPSVRMSQSALSIWVKNESEMRKRYEADVSQHELRRSRTSKLDDINVALAV